MVCVWLHILIIQREVKLFKLFLADDKFLDSFTEFEIGIKIIKLKE
jgi:hypothetical protein